MVAAHRVSLENEPDAVVREVSSLHLSDSADAAGAKGKRAREA